MRKHKIYLEDYIPRYVESYNMAIENGEKSKRQFESTDDPIQKKMAFDQALYWYMEAARYLEKKILTTKFLASIGVII